MKILHYGLGFPPNRTGGLVSYTLDLMESQTKSGDKVIYLYPGGVNFFKKKLGIKKDKRKSKKNFQAFELVNSLPLPLFGGIKEPRKFMDIDDNNIYRNFFEMNEVDIIHVHTLMGLHKTFFEVAHEKNIKIVMTTHDYFGIAPEPNFFLDGKNYDTQNNIENWIKVSRTAMSVKKLRLFQWKYYYILKKIAKLIKQKTEYLDKRTITNKEMLVIKTEEIKQYSLLKGYYLSILQEIDFFHFNSQLSKDVYQKNLLLDKYDVISITTATMKKQQINRQKHRIDRLRVGYIGPYKEYKGFYDFLKLLEELGTTDYEYHIYGDDSKIDFPKGIINHGRYSKEELAEVYENIDILIVPSKWKETFGLIVLEALSYGVHVILSNNVGAKDLVKEEYIYSDISELKNILLKINVSENEEIEIKTMETHESEIKQVYKKMIKGTKNDQLYNN